MVAAMLVVFGHAFWLGFQARRNTAVLPRARLAVAAVLDGEDPALPLASLRSLPMSLRRKLLVDLAPNLSGNQRDRLKDLAETLGVLDRGRRWLVSRWWWRRLWAAHLLCLIVDDEPGLRLLLHDPHPEVRAQGIDWAGDHADAEASEQLIALLADPSALCRATAKDSLIRAGLAPAPVIARHLQEETGALAASLLEVAGRRPDLSYVPGALKLAADDQPKVRAGAARLLGAFGGTEGVVALEKLLKDPAPRVREAAAGAIGRLGHWPAAPTVALLLRDAMWDVRKAAGQALVDLGAPGMIMLRRYGADQDPFAADMACMMQQIAQL